MGRKMIFTTTKRKTDQKDSTSWKMKNYRNKFGITLIEVLVVVAIVALLASVVIGLAGRMDNQGKERLTKNTIALIGNALEQFRDFGYQYGNTNYAEFHFPLDCNDSPNPPKDILEGVLQDALALAPGSVIISGVGGTPVIHQPGYSGSEAMYFFLSQVPQCRKTLDRIDESLLTDRDENHNRLVLNVAGRKYPLLRFIDPWGTALRYDYYYEDIFPVQPNPNTKRTFPQITSAGADRIFNTRDDISNIDTKR